MQAELKDKFYYNWEFLEKQNKKNTHTSLGHASLLNKENHLLMNVYDVLPTSGCLGHLPMRKSDGLKPSMEHSKTRPALGAWAHECALTTQCLPLENKVVDTN